MRAFHFFALVLLGCRPQSIEPCRIAPLELDFGEVQARPGAVYERFVTVTNPSSVDRFVIAEPLAFPFAAPEGPVLVKARSEALISIRFAAVDGLLHHEELILSSTDERCEFTVPLRALGSGLVRVRPEELEFTLGAGEVETKEVHLENTRRTPATVQLQWLTDAQFPFPLTFGPEPLTLPPGGSSSLPITAAPLGWDRVTAELRIFSPGQEVSVLVTLTPSSPRLEVSPLSIDIPVVGVDRDSQPPAFAERTIQVRNTGSSGNPTAPPLWLVANDPFFGNPDELHVTTPPLPLGLAEGESAELKVRVIPRFAGEKSFGVLISTDRFGPTQVRVSARAEVLPPCALRTEPVGVLELADALDGGLEGSVNFINEGTERCVVDNLRLREGTTAELVITGPRERQLEIPAGREHRVGIAGPKRVDAGIVGAFGFHVFRANGDDEWLELRAP